MVYLDTSALIRFFTNDEPQKALQVKKLLEKEKKIYISEVVFPELEYVLAGVYQSSRVKIITVFNFLASRKNIKLNPNIQKAIEIFETTTLDMANCLIVSGSLKGKLASFDKKLLSVKSVNKYW